MSDKLALDDAKHVVEDELGIKGFIETHQPEIFKWLEQRYAFIERMEGEERDDDLMFIIAEALPVITGIIMVGSIPKDFKNATIWVSKKYDPSDAKPDYVLSALTFIYVVDKAQEYYSKLKDTSKGAMWRHISKQVEKLLEGV